MKLLRLSLIVALLVPPASEIGGAHSLPTTSVRRFDRFHVEALTNVAIHHGSFLRGPVPARSPVRAKVLRLEATPYQSEFSISIFGREILPRIGEGGRVLPRYGTVAEALRRSVIQTAGPLSRMFVAPPSHELDDFVHKAGDELFHVTGLENLSALPKMRPLGYLVTYSPKAIRLAVRHLYGIAIREDIPMRVHISYERARGGNKDFVVLLAHTLGETFRLGLLCGHFATNEVAYRSMLERFGLGPKLGPFIDGRVLFLEPVEGQTLDEFQPRRYWPTIFISQAVAVLKLARFGLKADDLLYPANVIRTPDGDSQIIDPGTLITLKRDESILRGVIDAALKQVVRSLRGAKQLRPELRVVYDPDLEWMAATVVQLVDRLLGPRAPAVIERELRDLERHRSGMSQSIVSLRRRLGPILRRAWRSLPESDGDEGVRYGYIEDDSDTRVSLKEWRFTDGGLVRVHRLMEGVSEEELGRLCGISQTEVSNLEKAAVLPSRYKALFAAALRFDASEFADAGEGDLEMTAFRKRVAARLRRVWRNPLPDDRARSAGIQAAPRVFRAAVLSGQLDLTLQELNAIAREVNVPMVDLLSAKTSSDHEPPFSYADFVENLAAIAHSKDLTFKDLADRTGIGWTVVRRLLTEGVDLGPQPVGNLVLLMNALGVSVADVRAITGPQRTRIWRQKRSIKPLTREKVFLARAITGNSTHAAAKRVKTAFAEMERTVPREADMLKAVFGIDQLYGRWSQTAYGRHVLNVTRAGAAVIYQRGLARLRAAMEGRPYQDPRSSKGARRRPATLGVGSVPFLAVDLWQMLTGHRLNPFQYNRKAYEWAPWVETIVFVVVPQTLFLAWRWWATPSWWLDGAMVALSVGISVIGFAVSHWDGLWEYVADPTLENGEYSYEQLERQRRDIVTPGYHHYRFRPFEKGERWTAWRKMAGLALELYEISYVAWILPLLITPFTDRVEFFLLVGAALLMAALWGVFEHDIYNRHVAPREHRALAMGPPPRTLLAMA